jgi:hypothetical protein
MTSPVLTPSAVILLGIDAAVGHSQTNGNAFSRKSWVTEVLIERLLANLQNGAAAQTLRKVWATGKSVTPASANAIINELVLAGLIEPRGLHAAASWDVNVSRRNEVDTLWSALSAADRGAIQRSAQEAVAMSVAWSKTLKMAGASREDTS